MQNQTSVWGDCHTVEVTNFPATITVDLDAIARNVAVLRDRVAHRQVMVVVKADAYGHGLLPVARAAVRGGAAWLGVAQLAEAVQVRAGGVTAPLLTWLYQPDDDLTAAVAAKIDLAIAAVHQVPAVVAAAEATQTTANIHLKIDTGLGRNGATAQAWQSVLAAVQPHIAEGTLNVVSVWSHFACADEPQHPSNAHQMQVFDDALKLAATHGVVPELQHIANSAALLTNPASHYTLARTGLAAYGLSPIPQIATAHDLGLTPAMTLTAPLAMVKDVPAGSGVSYGWTYHTSAATRLGLVPIGYGDGIPRHASNTANVWVNGQSHTIAGRVCMDQFTVDLGLAHPDVGPGTVVELFGAGTHGAPTAQDWADAADTINYEIVTRLGARVPRRYTSSVPEEHND